jgi:hypothetical protein
MDMENLFPSRFLRASDLKGAEFTLQIKTVTLEKLEGDGEEENKGIVSFEKAKKSWVLNRTNAEALKLMFGRETKDWIGHWVTIYPETIVDQAGFAGEKGAKIPCLRVMGSPDITRVITAKVKRGRKTIHLTVRPTVKGKATEKGSIAATQEPAELGAISQEEFERAMGDAVAKLNAAKTVAEISKIVPTLHPDVAKTADVEQLVEQLNATLPEK